MLGAIAGDIIGSVYEVRPVKSADFPLFSPASRFTDDTVLTVAVASAIMGNKDYGSALRLYGRRYPGAGYGGRFYRWLFSDECTPYNSWGNGSAMRVCPVGFACKTPDAVLEEARKSAEVTHNHPEGIHGAQAAALAVFMAFSGFDKSQITDKIERMFGYNLRQPLDELNYHRLQAGGFSFPLKRAKGKTHNYKNSPEGKHPI